MTPRHPPRALGSLTTPIRPPPRRRAEARPRDDPPNRAPVRSPKITISRPPGVSRRDGLRQPTMAGPPGEPKGPRSASQRSATVARGSTFHVHGEITPLPRLIRVSCLRDQRPDCQGTAARPDDEREDRSLPALHSVRTDWPLARGRGPREGRPRPATSAAVDFCPRSRQFESIAIRTVDPGTREGGRRGASDGGGRSRRGPRRRERLWGKALKSRGRGFPRRSLERR